MSSQDAPGGKKRLRKRIQGIKLQPNKSAQDISIEILVDGTSVRKLPPVEKGQTLEWTNLWLPCDVHESSTITARVIEVHDIPDIIREVTIYVSQVMSQEVISMTWRKLGLKRIEVSFTSRAAIAVAYSKAFIKAQQMEKRREIVDKAGKVDDAFKTLLAMGRMTAELDPTGGAKVAFSLCTRAWEYLGQQEKQNESLNELVESIAEMIPSIDSVKNITEANLSQTVIAALNLIEDASLFILSYKPRETMCHPTGSSEDLEQTEEFVARFSALQKVFDRRVSVQTMRTLEIDRMYAKLKPTDLAGYDSDHRCAEGTRLDLVDELVGWAQKSKVSSRLAWVHGPSGFGKSSIATSLCLRLSDQSTSTLASSFFCKRDVPELRDPRRVLMAIAYGLARRWEPYRKAVTAAFRKDPELHSKRFQPLYNALLCGPLRVASASEDCPVGLLVVVVDALDECGDTVARRQLLRCLLDLSWRLSWLRILATSRPDPDVQEFFVRVKPRRYVEFDITRYDASADIRVFVQGYLGSMTGVKGWPNDTIDQISTRASGLFIWARTACKFIADGFDRRKRLDQVLSGSKLADIDLLYATAIRDGMLDADRSSTDYMLQCLAAVVVTAQRTPLSVANLALLLQDWVSEDVLERVVGSLSSVLYVDRNSGDAIRIFHPSFMDFIIDRSRSKELCVDLEQQNTVLAECCFKVMANCLKFNICGLETSDRFNIDIQDLDSRVEAAIRPHLSYSCLYWSSHLIDAHANRLETCLREFLHGRTLLYWVEALSLLGKPSMAAASLLSLARCPMPDSMQDCRAAANDAYRFVLSFYDVISRSTPHLYLSALAFAPRGSRVARCVRGQFPKLLTIAEGTGKEWTPCLRTIWVASEVYSTAYSPDSRRIVSGSGDGKVRVWDAETGDTLLDPLTGHSSSVHSVTFSSDGRWIVSGSRDKTIRMWDAETGKAKGGPLRGHKREVYSVAFSPNGCQIASGSMDKTVRIWETETGMSVLVLRGHSNHVWCVAFSPDGCRVVSGSEDNTLRVWDAKTGASVLEPLLGRSGPVNCVAFSHDGCQIVSSFYDGTVRIWDAKTGQPLLDPLQGHLTYVSSAAFSPDSRLIVSSSLDRIVRIWDAQTGVAIGQPLRGHSRSVYSVAFSTDGRQVVSGSNDKTIRIWDIAGGGTSGMVRESSRHNGHSGWVNSVTFSPDGQRIASGSHDKTVRVWDAETGVLALGPLEGHTNAVQVVTFSSDNRRIASGSDDHTVRIWNSETGMPVLGPLRGHSLSVHSVAFSPDCRLIVSGSDGDTIRIWDAETGHAIFQLPMGHSNRFRSVAFSADGRRIVSDSYDDTVRTWDVETGQAILGPLKAQSTSGASVAFSPDSHGAVAGSGDNTLRIRDVETNNPAVHGLLREHTDLMYSVTFSSDGRWIASACLDNIVRIWDVETSKAVLEPLLGHSDYVASIAFSPNGRRIVSSGYDSTVRIWDVGLHTGSSNTTPSFLPGTQAQLIPRDLAGDRVLASSVQLARHMHPKLAGWVTSTEGRPVVWLPPELREIDDSTIRIYPTRIRRRIIIDFTNFAHGTSWTSIVDAMD
ncbi:hypothetical protein FRC09_012598 [Ceratobasidium sp. 395]|nr:hypothetical protein FRC09_012598 [Ceratobasidium sp. 395]